MTTRILVVDDSLVERLLVEGMLRRNSDYLVSLAENGQEALDLLADRPPDLIITDLIMPKMDGLELTRIVRERHSQIPIILMTAFGDETTAIEALEAGATSYIAKAHKAERLIAAVDRVIKNSAAQHIHQQLGQCMAEYHARFALPNNRQLIRVFVDQIQQMMAGLVSQSTVERIRVGEAVEEAMLNAMYHGNLEVTREELAKVRAELDEQLLDRLIEERCRVPQFQERKILVIVHLTSAEARFVVRDEGRGFHKRYRQEENPTGENALTERRGLTLIHSLMDEVKYNEAGNELVMRKWFPGNSCLKKSTHGFSPLIAEDNLTF
jgi:CheY-like chemotaxis protein